MSKWQKIDPAEIKVGDRVKVRHVSDDYEETTSADVKHVTDLEIGIGPYTLHKNEGTWYIAKPKKAKPPTRPDEPPVGSFFRVDRTGIEWVRVGTWIHGYQLIPCDDEPRSWESITEPGDTIQRLWLTSEPTE
jgi:hypothetical protein